jgi:hypothetical protein
MALRVARPDVASVAFPLATKVGPHIMIIKSLSKLQDADERTCCSAPWGLAGGSGRKTPPSSSSSFGRNNTIGAASSLLISPGPPCGDIPASGSGDLSIRNPARDLIRFHSCLSDAGGFQR